MNTGRYTLKSFLTDHNLDQIIIPEIQRDYVWQEENVTKLLQSILENSKRQNEISQGTTEEELNAMSPAIREIVIREIEKNKNFCNVGFIYAYFDTDLAGRFMLIDGQQRMTTLFLLLLCLSVKENKQDQFRRAYFKDNILKFDYKVREASHDFMLNFVEHTLGGNNFNTITDQFWYYTDYEQDVTIQSVLRNYKIIIDFVNSNDLTLQYIEDYIEFWYFDTNKSKQGEELYIYMNSRGESVSAGESIKASLLKGLSEQEKHEWGSKWEKWQNLFWEYRKDNNNADKGLEEFLKWIKIIEITKKNSSKTIQYQEEAIRKIKDNSKISIEGITLQIIENYFTGLSTLIKFENDIALNKYWLAGASDSRGMFPAIDYMKLLPMLMYAEKYPESDLKIIKRFARFFQNISRFSSLSKNPFESLASIINLTKLFLDANYYDVTNLVDIKEKKSYESILTDEEIAKLTIYKQSEEQLRSRIETAFWTAEDFKLCEGKVWFIWYCMNYDIKTQLFDEQHLDNFTFTFTNFKSLFDTPDDLFRRALLTKGDYSIWDGRTATLDGDRYSFINSDSVWRRQLTSSKIAEPYKLLINEFGVIKKRNKSSSRDIILNDIISAFIKTTTEKNWIYYFVKEPNILSYCGQKLVCFRSGDAGLDNIVLLQSRNAAEYNWTYLKNKITIEV